MRVHATFSGLVQGVGFRNHTDTIGNMLGLSGTVENKDNNTVEVYVEGKEADVLIFLKAVSYAPRGGRVDGVTFDVVPDTNAGGKFTAIYPKVEYKFEGSAWGNWGGYGYGNEFLGHAGNIHNTGPDVCDVCKCQLIAGEGTFFFDKGDLWLLCKRDYKLVSGHHNGKF